MLSSRKASFSLKIYHSGVHKATFSPPTTTSSRITRNQSQAMRSRLPRSGNVHVSPDGTLTPPKPASGASASSPTTHCAEKQSHTSDQAEAMGNQRSWDSGDMRNQGAMTRKPPGVFTGEVTEGQGEQRFDGVLCERGRGAGGAKVPELHDGVAKDVVRSDGGQRSGYGARSTRSSPPDLFDSLDLSVS